MVPLGICVVKSKIARPKHTPEIPAPHFNSLPYPAQSAVYCSSFMMLPTPTNSVEMTPRKRSLPLSADAFDLGPAAIAPSSPSSIKFSTISNGRETLPSPTSPHGMFARDSPPVETKTETQQTPTGGRTRSASTSKPPAAKKQKKAAPIIKPPPPRRNPIIQMQPSESFSSMDTTASSTGASGKATGKKSGNGRKSATASTADERRKARKSTHSEIERRRRLKINSQFALLRSLVPACKDQDMHKLTILEATTEYIQYLVESIKQVKGHYDEDDQPTPSTAAPSPHSTTSRSPEDEDFEASSADEEEEEDQEMEDQDGSEQIHHDPRQHHYQQQSPYLPAQKPQQSPYLHSTQPSPYLAAQSSRNETPWQSPYLQPQQSSERLPSLMDISSQALSKSKVGHDQEDGCCEGEGDGETSTSSDYDATHALLLLSDRKGSMDSTYQVSPTLSATMGKQPMSVMQMLS